jgi:prevent-host-death family protein
MGEYRGGIVGGLGELLAIMQSRRNPRVAGGSTKAAYHALPAWKLQDAKARFSQVVREALEHGPQSVTLHGKDAVVILSAEAYGRLAPAAAQPRLHVILPPSPLRDLDFEHGSVRSPVRDVEL